MVSSSIPILHVLGQDTEPQITPDGCAGSVRVMCDRGRAAHTVDALYECVWEWLNGKTVLRGSSRLEKLLYYKQNPFTSSEIQFVVFLQYHDHKIII